MNYILAYIVWNDSTWEYEYLLLIVFNVKPGSTNSITELQSLIRILLIFAAGWGGGGEGAPRKAL
jgi:hypothetical protein